MKMRTLRNNIRKTVLCEEVTIKVAKEERLSQLMIREAQTNSSRDMMQMEIVLAIPGEGIFQLFTSEGYHRFDATEKTRNYVEAVEMTMEREAEIKKRLDGQTISKIEKVKENFMPTRMCSYFDINFEKWEVITGFSCEDDIKERIVVYGKGQAWDFGDNIDKAEAHYQNLVGKQ